MDLTALIKAYDVRGVVPDQLDEQIARAIGAAFVDVVGADRICDRARHARDPALVWSERSRRERCCAARPWSTRAWARPTCSTSQSGHLGLPGAMFTASHNPARYNGIKLCRAGAVAIGQDSGLTEIRTRAEHYLDAEIDELYRRRFERRCTPNRPTC